MAHEGSMSPGIIAIFATMKWSVLLFLRLLYSLYLNDSRYVHDHSELTAVLSTSSAQQRNVQNERIGVPSDADEVEMSGK